MANKIGKTAKDVKTKVEQIPLRFNVPVGTISKYATNMVVQANDQEVVIYFFEAQPPIFLEESEKNIEELKAVGIRADCVAKITVSKDRFKGFAKVFSEYLKEE